MPGRADGSDPDPVPAPSLSKAVLQSAEPICSRPTTIVCEDFETDDRTAWSDYEDRHFGVVEDLGLSGSRAIQQQYGLGQEDGGWLAWFFGDHPLGGVRQGKQFEEVYFRFYHRFEASWPAAFPPKMARMRSHYIDCSWCFAWREHFWLENDGTGVSDPVSNIPAPDGTEYVSAARWLGALQMDVRLSELLGEWVALEMRVRLNTPGKGDGRITFWANGEIVLDRTGLDIRGAYTSTTINVAMIDTYWNGGAPQAGLKRWYDNVVVSTEPIGCARFTVQKSGLSNQSAWQLQIARDTTQPALWDSGVMTGDGNAVDVSPETGSFSPGTPPCLLPSSTYFMRARHAQGEVWSEWSAWLSLT